MIPKSLLLCGLIGGLTGLCAWARDATPVSEKAPSQSDVAPAIDLLGTALESNQVAVDLRAAAPRLAEALRNRPAAAKRIAALASGDSISEELLRKSIEAVQADLRFEPTHEANTPRGWPSFTPPGEVELKSYPRYRMAEIENDAKLPPGVAFFTLFGHIQRNKIAMTAPVEMEMDRATDVGSPKRMAFLYETTDIGATGNDGKVIVKDIEPRLAVTAGLRGEMDDKMIAQAEEQIATWLATHPAYVADGPIRLMGYNGPSTPGERKYYEVQQVVKPIEPKK